MTPRQLKVGASHAALIALVVVIAFPVFYALIVSTLTFRQTYIYPPRLVPGV